MPFNSILRASAGSKPLQACVFQRAMSSTAVATSDNRIPVKFNGRQSSSGITATIFGASGFVGRYVVSRLGRIGSQVVIPYRGDGMMIRHLKPMGDLGQIIPIPLNMCDEDTIREAVKHSNVIINLIGNRHQTNNYNYDDTHVKCAHRIAKICAETGNVKRFIHVSALNADADSKSEFLASKARGEEAIKAYFPNATILRPAPVFGDEDYLLNQIAEQINMNHLVPTVGDGSQKIAPVYVQDLAQGIVNSVVDSEAPGKTYHVVGPEEMTRLDLFNFVKKDIYQEHASMIPVPVPVARFMGQLAEKFVPAHDRNLNPDYCDQMQYDMVLPNNAKYTLADLGVKPVSVQTDGRKSLIVHRLNREPPEKFDWNDSTAKGYGHVENFGGGKTQN